MAATPDAAGGMKASTSSPQQLGDTCDYAEKMAPELQKEFVRLKGVTYLDHAGATLYAESQLKSVFDDLRKSVYGNPHSHNPSSQMTSEAIDQVRFRILQFFNTNADDYDVVFTANATAAIKLVAECLQWSENDVFTYIEDNHTSVLGIRAVAAAHGARVQCLNEEQMEDLLKQTDLKNCRSSVDDRGFGVFAFPAESNFCGRKYPLVWIRQMDSLDPGRQWLCLLDAAAFVANSPLDLKSHRPDFVCMSFYKMFGFPTGIGALLVSRRADAFMRKTYFGGGTVLMALPGEVFHISRPLLHDRLEDGTLPFLDILAIRHGLDTLETLAGGMEVVNERTFLLGRYVYRAMSTLRHANGRPVVELYCRTQFADPNQQGPIVTFNLLRADGSHVGFAQVDKMASLHNIHVRTGCFCNTGACRHYLKLSRDDLIANYEAGHVCGDDKDLVDGRPTGAVRVSFGYMSTIDDANNLLHMINNCFVEKNKKTLPKMETKPHRNGNDLCRCRLDIFGYDECQENHLTNIFLYPVKSCGAFEVSSWTIGERGLNFDREWVVVNANGVSLTQKREPRLCLIRPEIDLENKLLHLHSEGFSSTSISLDVTVANLAHVRRCNSRVCGDRVSMIDCGDKAAEWISDVLDNPGCRLLRQHPDSDRRNKLSRRTSYNEVTEQRAMSLANQAQFLLLSCATIRHLLHEIEKRRDEEDEDEDAAEQLDEEKLVARFRANLVVSGKEAYAEDIWSQVSIGQVPFEVHGCCSRCQMVSIDQSTSYPTTEPLTTLSATRGHKVTFGIYLHHKKINKEVLISVGDPVVVVAVAV